MPVIDHSGAREAGDILGPSSEFWVSRQNQRECLVEWSILKRNLASAPSDNLTQRRRSAALPQKYFLHSPRSGRPKIADRFSGGNTPQCREADV